MTAMVFAPGSLCACSCLVFVYVLYRSLPDIYGTGSKLSLLNNPSGFAPVVRVMFGWISLYFTFLFYQSWTKFYALIQLKRDARSSEDKPPSFADVKYRMAAGNKFFALNGDRTVGNMLEQSFPFLVSLWLHAFYADVGSAAQLGWIWLLFRAFYPASARRAAVVEAAGSALGVGAMALPLELARDCGGEGGGLAAAEALQLQCCMISLH